MTIHGQKNGVARLIALPCARRPVNLSASATIIAQGFFLALLAAGLTLRPAVAADAIQQPFSPGLISPANDATKAPATVATQPVQAQASKRASFGPESASPQARQVADWVVDSGDNRGMPFVIVDKAQAKVFVFDAEGRLRGAAPALLGLAQGDDSVPGIGDRKLSTIRPEERTTPAGRFVASMDRNLQGKDILWVDYDSAISLHRVITSNPQERRLQRLNSPTLLDRRISYGCINVPVTFFDKFVSPSFKGTNGIVYVLPETRPAREVFASYYDVDERVQRQAVAPPMPTQIASQAGINLAR
jgi:hypothetical protein